MNSEMHVVKRNTLMLVAIASLILNCILGILLYDKSTISAKSSAVYAVFLGELQAAMQESDRAIHDTGKPLQYDVNQQNQYISDASSLLAGMEPEMMHHGIDVSQVVNALYSAFIPNLTMPNIINESHVTINEVYNSLGHTEFRDGRVAQLKHAVVSLTNKLASRHL